MSLTHFENYYRVYIRCLRLFWESPGRPYIGIGVLGIMIGRLLPVAVTWFMGAMINEIQKSSSAHHFSGKLILGAGIAVIFLVTRAAITNVLQPRFDWLEFRLEQHFDFLDARKRMELDFASLVDPEYERLKDISGHGRGGIQQFLAAPVQIASILIAACSVIALLWSISAVYVFGILIASIPLIVVQFKSNWRQYRMHYDNSPEGRTMHWMMRAFSDEHQLLELRIFGSMHRLYGQALGLSRTLKGREIRLNTRTRWLVSLATLFASGMVGLFVAHVGYSVVYQGLAIGTAGFIVASINTLSSEFSSVARAVSRLPKDTVEMSNYIKSLDWEPSVRWSSSGWKIGRDEPVRIEFDHVSFCYPRSGAEALKDVSCAFEIGDRIGIVGENGSGKSTFIKLLLRVYDPTQGRILINGHDLRDADQEAWYALLSVLQQEVEMYRFGSIYENVALGSADPVSRTQVECMLSRTGLSEFVRSLPHGIDTITGSRFEDGLQFSGGQEQRLALARALIKNPRILVLDEPTSAIDAIGEQKIFDEVFGCDGGRRLTVCISHRFTTLVRASHILVFQDGSMVQQGSHTELKTIDGPYRRLFEAQTLHLF